MTERPYTVLSCCTSLDGYLDAGGEQRLVLSNQADLCRVDALRAWSDAILVGAATVRNDDPRLLVRDGVLRQARVREGRTVSPVKVTVTGSGEVPVDSHFFTSGDVDKLVYCPSGVSAAARRRLGPVATVVAVPGPPVLTGVLTDLHRRGVRRLMVEGGGRVLTQVLTEDLADELHLAVAPFFVGSSRAHRFVGDGEFPFHAGRRATLRDTVRLGDVVLLRYDLSARARARPVAAGAVGEPTVRSTA